MLDLGMGVRSWGRGWLVRAGCAFLFLGATCAWGQFTIQWYLPVQTAQGVFLQDVVQHAAGMFVVGYCGDSESGLPGDGLFLDVSADGDLRTQRRWHLGLNTGFFDCCSSGGSTLYTCGSVDDSLDGQTYGLVAAMTNSGDTLWTKRPNDASGRSLEAVSIELLLIDQVSVVGRRTNSSVLGNSLYSAVFDTNGQTISYHYFGESFGQITRAVDHSIAPSGDFLIVGTVERVLAPIQSSRTFAICLSQQGDTIWNQHYPLGESESTCGKFAMLHDGGFYVPIAASNGDSWSLFLVRCTAEGDTVWRRSLVDSVALATPISCKLQMDESRVYVYYHYSLHDFDPPEFRLAVVREDGFIERDHFLLFSSADTTLTSITVLSDSQLVVLGGVLLPGQRNEGFMARFTDDILSADGPARTPTGVSSRILSFLPNPFNSSTTLSFELGRTSPVEMVVYDVLGRVVRNEELGVMQAGQHRIGIDARDLSSGSYWVTLEANRFREAKKIVVVR